MRLTSMRKFRAGLSLFASVSLSLAPQAVAACTDPENAFDQYAHENFAGDEEKPIRIGRKIDVINATVSAVSFVMPKSDPTETSRLQHIVLFFTGSACTMAYQADGEISQALSVSGTTFVFVAVENTEQSDIHRDFQVLTITPEGTVAPTRDQQGGDIQFSENFSLRCEGKVGEFAVWSHDKASQVMSVRQRHIERDGQCRITEDSSSYRYYRLTAALWQLDDDSNDSQRPEISERPRKKQ